MGKKSTPAPPDYTKAAEQTAASSQQAQTRADWANRPQINTPWGQQSWQASAGTDPSTGQPITNWQMNLNLSPQEQASLNDQMAIQSGRSNLAQGMLGRLGQSYQQPFNWSDLSPMGQAPDATAGLRGGIGAGTRGMQRRLDMQAGDASRQRVEQGMLDRMRPEHEFAQGRLETQLRGQGLSRGSEAWDREMQRLGDQQSRERFNALEQGGIEQQRQFGMGLQGGQFQNQAANQAFQQRLAANQFGNQAAGQAFGQSMQAADYQNRLRQQQIAEQMQQRGMPLNELNALLTGQQVGMPQMPGFSQSQSAGGANYLGAANAGYNAQLDAYNAKQAQRQGMFSGIGGLAGMLGGMF